MTMFKIMSHLSANKFLIAISNVFLMALPLALISTFFELIALGSKLLEWPTFTENIQYVSKITGLMFPILLNFYLSKYLSAVKQISKGIAIATSLTLFFVVSHQWNFISSAFPFPNNIPISLFTAYLSCEILFRLKTIKIFCIRPNNAFGNMSPPIIAGCFFTIIIVTFTSYIFHMLFVSLSSIVSFSMLPKLDPTSFVDGVIYELLRGLLWSVGINGHNILNIYKTELHVITQINISDWQHLGTHLNIISLNFYDFFTGLGGSGNMLSLVLCMLFFSKNSNYKILAKAGLVLCIFNINEPILYGVPVIFNPIMLVPFLLVPMVSFIIAYMAIYWGFIPPLSEIHSWLIPPFLSGYIATGTILGSLLQLVLVIIGMGIYYPFFKVIDKCSLGIGVSDLFINRIFANKEIETKTRFNSFIPSFHQNIKAQRKLEKLQSQGEFILYFQPQVDITKNSIVSLEALIRYRDHQGNILPPTFISEFSQLGLMPELDFLVLEKAIQAGEKFVVINPDIKISINVSPETVLHENFIENVKKIITNSSLSYSYFEFELTEEVLFQDSITVAKVITTLQQLGISVALDDFGSGYSSLAYLSRFDFDKVKIDRSLVLNLDSQRGQDLFKIAVQLGEITHAQIVVEGIEDKFECDFVASVGVRYIQGFYFYRPLSQQDVFALNLLQDNHAKLA